MRKPWYWKYRGWYYDLDSRGSKQHRRVFLSRDRDEAFAIWKATYRTEPPSLRNGESSRKIGVERILVLIELLAPLRRGAEVQELAQDVADILGREYCDRTIERDLTLLHELGIAERVKDEVAFRWRFIDRSVRSAVLSKVAEMQAIKLVS